MNINVEVKTTLRIDVENYSNYLSVLKESKVGVYVFYDKHDQPIYVGKTKNLNTRVREHINGGSNVPQIKRLAKYCDIHFIDNYAMADIYETFMINELKPLFNIDKATYAEFIDSADESLYETEEEIREIKSEITDLQFELEEADDVGEVFVIQREIKERRVRIAELEVIAAVFKRRGGTSLTNRTVEDFISDDKKRKSAAFLAMR